MIARKHGIYRRPEQQQMANNNLRQALQQAGVQPDELAEMIDVDPRSVRRWLNGNTTPYPRLRTRIARALETEEDHLWPRLQAARATRAASSQPSDLVAGYSTAEDLDAPNWKHLMRDAVEQIDLYGDTLEPIIQTPGVPELLTEKGSRGCVTRILVSSTGRYLEPLLDLPRIEIRVLAFPRATHTAYRFDDDLLLITPLHDQDHVQGPLFHLRRAAPGGLVDRFVDDFSHQWEYASQALDSDVDIYDDVSDDDDADAQPVEPSARGISLHERIDTPAPAPRRWPGRRD